MKRRLLVAAGVAVAVLAAACSGGTGTASSQSPVPASPTSVPTATTAAPATASPTAVPTVAPTAAPAAPPTAAPAAAPSAVPAPAPPYARITTGSGRQLIVRLEVADTPDKQTIGLSRRPTLPASAGMVFVFPADQLVAFWMKDTYVPLSIAFISKDGQILEIQDMAPLSEDVHRPALPYRYALEVNQGYFDRNGAGAGDRVEFVLGGSQ